MRQPDAAAQTAPDHILEGFLGEFARALRAAGFYPPSHPALRAATVRVHEAYSRLAGSRKGDASTAVLDLGVSRRGFTDSGRPVAMVAAGAAHAAHECLVRGVTRLFFRPSATPDDFARLLEVLVAEPDEVTREGGFEAQLAATGVRNIWANEVDPEAILRKIAEADRAEAETRQRFEHPDDGVASPPEAAEAVQPEEPEQLSVEQKLLTLLAELERQTDGIAYQETLGHLRGVALELRDTAPYETLLPALVVLGQHSSGAGGRRGVAIQQMADALLAELVNETVLGWLVHRVCRREARGERELIGRVFIRLGARGLVPLVEALTKAEDRGARRTLSQVIALFGEAAVPELEMRAHDQRWFVVRNMAALLGDIRAQGSVSVLTELLAHEDGRVRRAALQALAKIGGREATALVVRCLTSGDKELQVQAILAVGAWREATALPTLEALARGGGGRRTSDVEVRRHAIEALGLVGGRPAVRVLADLVKPGRLWDRLFGRREGALIRIAAAEALASIGGSEARHLLQAAANERGAVGNRCRVLATWLG
jgi:HEAT repeat protein